DAGKDQFFADMKAKMTPAFSAWQDKELCIQFTPSGDIQRYQCLDNTLRNADGTYSPDVTKAHVIAHDGVRINSKNRYQGTPLETIHITEPTIIYSTEDIEVRGLLNGQVTVVSERDVRIGGDVQYYDQGPFSTDRFGAIAERDIMIPHYSPSHRYFE